MGTILSAYLTNDSPPGEGLTKITGTTIGNVHGLDVNVINSLTIASSPLPTGAATEAKQDNAISLLTTIDTDTGSIATSLATLTAVDYATETTLSSIDGKIVTADTTDVRQATHDNLNANANIQVGNTDVSAGNPIPVSEEKSSTGTPSNIAASATNVTLLSSNASRIGATFFNDSTATLYLKLGAIASSTSFTVAITEKDYYEVPFKYTGIIDGVWETATGAVRVTELT